MLPVLYGNLTHLERIAWTSESMLLAFAKALKKEPMSLDSRCGPMRVVQISVLILATTDNH